MATTKPQPTPAPAPAQQLPEEKPSAPPEDKPRSPLDDPNHPLHHLRNT